MVKEEQPKKKVQKVDNIKDIKLDVLWEGKPCGIWQRFLTKLHLNFTTYQITNDELIIKKGFFKQTTNTIELYLLKDPDMEINIYQRIIKVGTVSVLVDGKSESKKAGTKLYLENIENPEQVRKLLRDAIEDDVMERKITYFDRV